MRLVIAAFLMITVLSCTKKEHPVTPRGRLSTIVYLVRGSNIRMNYIDSASVFQRDKVFTDSFRYEFKKGSGASIGMSVYRLSPDDSINEWDLYIDGKLYANAFSEGGVYMIVPYY